MSLFALGVLALVAVLVLAVLTALVWLVVVLVRWGQRSGSRAADPVNRDGAPARGARL